MPRPGEGRRETRDDHETRPSVRLPPSVCRLPVPILIAEAAAWCDAEMKSRKGYFGAYGGRFAPETLMAPLEELEKAFERWRRDRRFRAELQELLSTYAGRPTPITVASRLAEKAGGARIALKREDLLHTGAHKLNNALGQALLARRMGKARVVAETGAGQHGVATAAAAARVGLPCRVYMGSIDMERQAPNVLRMRLLGAEVVPVDSGSRTLKDAISEAMRDWSENIGRTHYVLGSALGPHPYPAIVREFQSVIGREARSQFRRIAGRDPDAAVACVGGGSNAIGLFSAFLESPTRLYGVEAGGRGSGPGEHAARFSGGSPGVLHGTLTMLLQDEAGRVLPTHSVAAGLDYPAVGPEHAFLADLGRVEYATVSDGEALDAFETLSRAEGIVPALESAHAIAFAMKRARKMARGRWILVNLSGRGDKDLEEYARLRPGREA
jgi:tryptophan synthase beta chain